MVHQKANTHAATKSNKPILALYRYITPHNDDTRTVHFTWRALCRAPSWRPAGWRRRAGPPRWLCRLERVGLSGGKQGNVRDKVLQKLNQHKPYIIFEHQTLQYKLIHTKHIPACEPPPPPRSLGWMALLDRAMEGLEGEPVRRLRGTAAEAPALPPLRACT